MLNHETCGCLLCLENKNSHLVYLVELLKLCFFYYSNNKYLPITVFTHFDSVWAKHNQTKHTLSQNIVSFTENGSSNTDQEIVIPLET